MATGDVRTMECLHAFSEPTKLKGLGFSESSD
jgi:hypothetical protein